MPGTRPVKKHASSKFPQKKSISWIETDRREDSLEIRTDFQCQRILVQYNAFVLFFWKDCIFQREQKLPNDCIGVCLDIIYFHIFPDALLNKALRLYLSAVSKSSCCPCGLSGCKSCTTSMSQYPKSKFRDCYPNLGTAVQIWLY